MLEPIRYLFQFGKISCTGESADKNVDLNSTMSLLRVAQDMTSVQAFPGSDVMSQ